MFSLLLAVNLANILQDPSTDAHFWPRFLLQVIIILVLCKLLGWVLGFLKQPPVIGEIIAGILVGPSVLGQWSWWSLHVFQPYNVSSLSVNCIVLVADIGIILFMFYLGLELDEKLVKKMWKSSLPIAVACVVFPFSIGIATATWLYNVNNEYLDTPVDRTAFYLFAGASMSFTALPVLASLLAATGLISTPLGIQTISCATVDDLLAWCVLAVSTSFAKGEPESGGVTFALAIAYVLFMFLIVRPFVARIHAHYLNKNQEFNANFTFLMILVLLFSAFFSEIINIHSFFGAFIAGLVMPKSGSWHLAIGEKIEFLAKELFLPLFFVSSGAKTNIGSLNNSELGGVTVAVIVIATIGKFTPGCLFTKLITKRDWKFCVTVGILMNTRGLVELIALNIGYSLGILSQQLFTVLVLMALATTIMTAPLVYFIYQRSYIAELGEQATQIKQHLHEVSQKDMEEKGDDAEVIFHHPSHEERFKVPTTTNHRNSTSNGLIIDGRVGDGSVSPVNVDIGSPSHFHSQIHESYNFLNRSGPSRLHPMNISGGNNNITGRLSRSGELNRSGGLTRSGGGRSIADNEFVQPMISDSDSNNNNNNAASGNDFNNVAVEIPSPVGRTPHPSDTQTETRA